MPIPDWGSWTITARGATHQVSGLSSDPSRPGPGYPCPEPPIPGWGLKPSLPGPCCPCPVPPLLLQGTGSLGSQHIALRNNSWGCATALLWVFRMVGRGGGRLEALTYYSKAVPLLHLAFRAQATSAPCHPRALATAIFPPLITSHSREPVKPKYQLHRLGASVNTLDACALPAAALPVLQGLALS